MPAKAPAESMSPDPIPISALQHFVYCPRQCALIHVAQVWSENLHTQKGRREHARVDEPASEQRDGIRIERALPVWSERLGIIGKCDVVEFHPHGMVYPVEYKHGPRRKGLHDDVQLCAQALCLEEMLDVTIAEGAIFHVSSRRRRVVKLDDALRKETQGVIEAVRAMLDSGQIPMAEHGMKCERCSLRNACLPDARQVKDIGLFEPLEDNECISF